MSTTRYTRTAIGLHWVMAVGFIAMFLLGFYMQDLPITPQQISIVLVA